jgi:hypothetical protein
MKKCSPLASTALVTTILEGKDQVLFHVITRQTKNAG